MVPQCARSCKNIDHGEGRLLPCRSQCYLNFFIELAKFLLKAFEHTRQIEFPRHISEQSYSEHSKVEMTMMSVN